MSRALGVEKCRLWLARAHYSYYYCVVNMIEKSYGSYGDDTRYAIKNELTVYNEMKT